MKNDGLQAQNPSNFPLRRRWIRHTPPSAYGEPMIWLTGGSLAICLVMIAGLLLLIAVQGLTTFWPLPITRIETVSGEAYMGEIVRQETFRPDPKMLSLPEAETAKIMADIQASGGWAQRRMIRSGNFELTGTHFHWINNFEIAKETRPQWALIFERASSGRFYGLPQSFVVDGTAVASAPREIWRLYNQFHPEIVQRSLAIGRIEKYNVGKVNRILENARLSLRDCELRKGNSSAEYAAEEERFRKTENWANEEFNRLREEIAQLRQQNERYQIVLMTSSGEEHSLSLADLVRGYPANRLSWMDKINIYASRWKEFLLDDPREANSEGGVFPAIFGMAAMTLTMALAVVPFGVLAALYLREYARAGLLVSAIRIAVNNLAGVPSIVYGVFGLGFFCYFIGGAVDAIFYPAKLPNPTYGTGGLLWASLTLALLTLPVVIVATEEALAAVPNSMREGSYACGASQWQTIRRIVLPRAMPGVMTGMILAMARGAGEVAPIMLVGAVKLAPDLPIDGVFPYLHLERSFMHLGFHIYDLGFQSQNSEAARPMVFTTTLLLIVIVFLLNAAAVWLRARLRQRFAGGQF